MANYCKHCNEEVPRNTNHRCGSTGRTYSSSDNSFLISAAIGAVTGSALLGGFLGGDMLGGVVGDIFEGGGLFD